MDKLGHTAGRMEQVTTIPLRPSGRIGKHGMQGDFMHLQAGVKLKLSEWHFINTYLLY